MIASSRTLLLAAGALLTGCSGDLHRFGESNPGGAAPVATEALPLSVSNIGFDPGVALVDPVSGQPTEIDADAAVVSADVPGFSSLLLYAFSTRARADNADGGGTPLDPSAPSDTNAARDVFVGAITPNGEVLDVVLVSQITAGGKAGSGASSAPSIVYQPNPGYDPNDPANTNPAGEIHVAYQSMADNLVAGDTNGRRDIYYAAVQLRVAAAPATGLPGRAEQLDLRFDGSCAELVSSTYQHVYPPDPCGARIANGGNGDSSNPTMARDGRVLVVVFESEATDLVANDSNGSESDILRRELIPDFDLNQPQPPPPHSSYSYYSKACSDCHEWHADPMSRLSASFGNPTASADAGSFNPVLAPGSAGINEVVAFESDATDLVPSDSNGQRDVFWGVFSRGTGQPAQQIVTLARASVRAGGGQGTGGDSRHPSLHPIDAAAGEVLVAFESDKVNLAPQTASTNVYLHDSRGMGSTWLLNQRFGIAGGQPAGSDAFAPVINADGSAVIFSTAADNLDVFRPKDDNGAIDVLLADISQLTTSGALRHARVSISNDGRDANGDSTPSGFGAIEPSVKTGANGQPLAFVDALFAKSQNPRCINCHGFNAANSTRKPNHPPGSNCNGCHKPSFTNVADWRAPPPDLDFRQGPQKVFEIFRNASPPDPKTHLDNDERLFWALENGRVPTPNGQSWVATTPVAGGRAAFDAQAEDWAEGGFLFRDPSASGGNFVTYTTAATNLGASQQSRQVFGFLITPPVELVSKTSGFAPGGGELLDGVSSAPSVSSDDRWVAFETTAAIDVTDRNRAPDIYVRDTLLGDTYLVSRAAGTNDAADGASRNPAAAVDDRGVLHIAFESTATNLLSGFQDGNGPAPDVFLARFDSFNGRNASTINISLISGAQGSATKGGSGGSASPDIGGASPVSVVFESVARDLVTGFVDANGLGQPDVFLRSSGGAVELVSFSTSDPTTGGDGGSSNPCLSGDGSVAAFESRAGDLVAGGFRDNNGASQPDIFRRTLNPTGAAVLMSAIAASPPSSVMVSLPASKDNSIYSLATANSNALGDIWAGNNSGTRGANTRRGLIAFDVTAIPVGVTIVDAKLTMTSNFLQGAVDVSLHKLLQGWGEGGVSSSTAGQGSAATAGDATWIDRFFPGTTWTTPGGTFEPVASATTNVLAMGADEWSSPDLAADVESWVDDPSANFGWVILGDETRNNTTIIFGSRESTTTANPQLDVTYAAAPPPPGGGNAGSFRPRFDHDGSVMVFESQATDLLDTPFVDNNGPGTDVFARDVAVAVNSLVSVSTVGAGQGGADTSARASLNAAGDQVAFESLAPDLVDPDGNGTSDVFVRSLGTGVTRRVSVGQGQIEASGASIGASIGSQVVVFSSDAANLIGAEVDTNQRSDVFRSNR